jgi:hypothetical protein
MRSHDDLHVLTERDEEAHRPLDGKLHYGHYGDWHSCYRIALGLLSRAVLLPLLRQPIARRGSLRGVRRTT